MCKKVLSMFYVHTWMESIIDICAYKMHVFIDVTKITKIYENYNFSKLFISDSINFWSFKMILNELCMADQKRCVLKR